MAIAAGRIEFFKGEKREVGELFIDPGLLFLIPFLLKNIGSEVEIKAGKLARGTNVYSVTKMFPRKEKEVCSTAFL